MPEERTRLLVTLGGESRRVRPNLPPPRPRPGSLDRPVNARMYRGTWLLVGLPLLVAAFTIGRPDPLPAPALPPTFDGQVALALAGELARRHPSRAPGSPGALGAARWVTERFRLYGFRVREQAFEAEIPGLGRVPVVNLLAVAPGPSPESPTIVVMAHRDDAGVGRGANDNASGTAALIELARPYARSGPGRTVVPTHTIVFLSTDAGAFGSVGAARFAADSVYRDRIVGVINLDTIAGPGPARLELAGDEARSPAAGVVQTAADRITEETGVRPERPGALAQLIDLGFPFSLYEQAPFVARGVPAITLTTEDERPPPPLGDSPDTLQVERLEEVGRAAQHLLSSLDQGAGLTLSTGSYVYLGPRLVRGWAIQLVLIAALLPFLAAAVDLFARCRRRRIPLTPALRSYWSRLGVWISAGALFGLLALFGAWPEGTSRPISPETEPAGRWAVVALSVLGLGTLLAWLVVHERLQPRRPARAEEQLAGYTAALLVLSVLALVVIATNAFALVFLLPSLHAWLWLPQLRQRSIGVRLAVLAAGLLGPLLLLGSFATRFELGLDAPWYVLALVSVGYVDPAAVVIAIVWVAAAGQLTALATGRYAPYPSARERPPRGPLRELARRLALAVRTRRRPAERPQTVELP